MRYLCQACGWETTLDFPTCPDCGEARSFVVIRPGPTPSARKPSRGPVPLSELGTRPSPHRSTGFPAIDRVLGAGLPLGAVSLLLGGEPGIGKSTLLLQVAAGLAGGPSPLRVLYVSTEEAEDKIRDRAERTITLTGDILVAARQTVEAVEEDVRFCHPDVLILDSLSAIVAESLPAPAWSVAQVRESTGRFLTFSRMEEIPVILNCHVSKDGTLAGPKTIEHLVDIVLYLMGSRTAPARVLRAVKNRYGPTNEEAPLVMTERGLVEGAVMGGNAPMIFR